MAVAAVVLLALVAGGYWLTRAPDPVATPLEQPATTLDPAPAPEPVPIEEPAEAPAEEAAAEPATLDIVSQPVGAQVFIDGEERGVTPLTIDFEDATEVLLELRKRGYRSLEERVNVEGNVRTRYQLQRARRATMMRATMMEAEMGGFRRFD